MSNTYQFTHSNKASKEVYSAVNLPDKVAVSWTDSKGEHTVHYSFEEASGCILSGDWLLV